MATRFLYQSLAVGGRSLLSTGSRSYATTSTVFFQKRPYLFRIRPLVAASSAFYFQQISPSLSTRSFATRPTSSSLSDPNPNWSNRPPKETILLDGCDFEHWLVVMEKPEGDPTRDEIIDSYIKTLSTVVGSEEEARMKIYSVSTRHYFAFGALVSEELSYKLKELPRVRWVLPDSYLDVKNKDYGGEPFINGQAVPYDPKYHEEWVRNNARANERNRRNDRPRQFDRSRNFERRRDQQQMGDQNYGGSFGGNNNNMASQPNAANAPNPGPMQPNMGGQTNYNPNTPPPSNFPNPSPMQQTFRGQANYSPNMPPPTNSPNPGSVQPNSGGQPSYGNVPNQGSVRPNIGGQAGYAPNMSPPANPGSVQPNMGGQSSYGNMSPQGNVPIQNSVRPNIGGQPGYAPHMSPPPNAPYPGQVQNNMGGGYPSYSGGFPTNNTGYTTNNAGGGQRYPPGPGGFAPRAGPNQGQYQYQNPNANNFSQPSGSGPGQAYNAPNMPENQGQNPYRSGGGGYAAGGNQQHDQNFPPQAENIPTRD